MWLRERAVCCAAIWQEAFAQAGAKVAALDLNEDKGKKLAEELKMKDLYVRDMRQMCWKQSR
ncbi:MAG: hypothetical protein ACLTH3_08275 [Lachnospira sp.]